MQPAEPIARQTISAATSLPPQEIYACPKCGGGLTAADAAITVWACEQGHRYPVTNGVPRFVHDEGYSGSFGFQWQRHDTVQLDSHSQSTLSRDRFFRGTRWPERMDGELILEAGCGSGRFTEVLLSTGARVVSFDYSRAADVAQRSFGSRGATVCQASIYEMPYRAASFDRVFCFGVIQHCPDVKAAFMSLARMVRPGGHLAVDVYDWRRKWLNARYRVRWITKRMNKERLHRLCERIVPLYMKLMPAMHPWNQLVFPIKDYRGALPGLTRAQEERWSVLDTFDALSPEYDQPQRVSTMRRWAKEAGLVDVDTNYGGNGVELRARRP